VRLALDAMGGDQAPHEIVAGGVQYAQEHPEDQVVLVGAESRVRDALVRVGGTVLGNVSIHHASEEVAMDDSAVAAVRKKRDSSLRICFHLIREGKADAMVSAGHSGAVMAGALFSLGRVRGVDRPAIAALLPSLKGGGRCLLLDAGANTECRPEMLAQFGVLGEAYVRTVLRVPRPRVAVLSNGEEDSKGTPLTREALALLRKSDLHCVGYVEGKDLFSGEIEVVVTDGFTGNVVLKTSEGAATAVAGALRTAIDKGWVPEKLGAFLLKPTLLGLKKMVDYAEYGGAPLLGIDGVGVVAHGRSSAKAIKNALLAARRTADSRLPEAMAEAMKRASVWLPARRRE
jgi:glycerol-3-phosphate acyltransferase PlsX